MNNYRIICQIGTGAYSVVYKAIDLQKCQIVAIKKISQQQMTIHHIMQRQVQLLEMCSSHPNIIKLLKCINQSPFTYLVFQYMAMDLITYYKQIKKQSNRNLNQQQICLISYQLVSVLYFFKQNQIIHRDIKPENVLIDPKTLKIKLIDFGFAKRITHKDYHYQWANKYHHTQYMVTRWYRPMQIVLGLQYDHKVDVFAAGALILELYLGKQVFRSTSNLDQFNWIFSICGFPTNWQQGLQAVNKLDLKIQQKHPQLKKLMKGYVRPIAADLIRKMLLTSPQQRISIQQVLQHPYFSKFNKFKTQQASFQNSLFYKQQPILTRQNRSYSTDCLDGNFTFRNLHGLQKKENLQNKLIDKNFTESNIITQNKKPQNGFITFTNNQHHKDHIYKNKINQKVEKPIKGLRNRIRSSHQGINVISLKKFKTHPHKFADNCKSRQKLIQVTDKPERELINIGLTNNRAQDINRHEYSNKNSGVPQLIKLNSKRQLKQKAMFSRIKERINQGNLQQRGQKSTKISLNSQNTKQTSNEKDQQINGNNQNKLKRLPIYQQYKFNI